MHRNVSYNGSWYFGWYVGGIYFALCIELLNVILAFTFPFLGTNLLVP